MNDFRDLKAIAEACQQHQPLRFMRSHGALYIRNDNGIVFDVHQNRSFPEFMAQNKDYADLVIAANPAAVLELIADHKRLTSENASLRGSQKALGKDLTQAVRAANKVTRERDRLKSEIAGLKTGYEAYERVNAELRAENEKLRKDSARYRFIRTDVSMGKVDFCIVRKHWSDGALSAILELDAADSEIDAAMSKEQSHG